MLETIRTRGNNAIWPALIGVLLAMGLLLPVLSVLEMDSFAMAIVSGVVMGVCCGVAGLGGRMQWLGIALGVVAVFVLLGIAGGMDSLVGAVEGIIALAQGNGDTIKAYGPILSVVLGCGLTLAGWAMARQGAGFYPALSLTMIVLLVIWFSPHRNAAWLFAPALVALCILFARSAGEETPVSHTLVASALAVILALTVSPILQFRSAKLEDFAERLRVYITDTLSFTEPRAVYSIEFDGYKPLENRLGGPLNLEDRPVMTVQTPTTVLLRGTIYDEYNGLNWYTSMSLRRYLHSDPRNWSIRADTMDENRPSEALQASSDIFRTVRVNITMNSNSATSLFVPLRADELTMPITLVPYFNQSSEIFVTRDLQAGDSYSVTAPVLNGNDNRLPQLLAQAAAESTERRDMSTYLKLPDSIAAEVYTLTRDIITGANTPLEQARAIQTYLQQTFNYTTMPAAPPGNQDFVSYFLLRGQTGYCTYFASAMAVMCRIAGIPSRYIEGYLAQPSGGYALVTSKQAHAWVELYFEGFGWIPFDPTPPASQGGPRADENQSQYEPGETPEEIPPPEEEQNPDEQDEQDNPEDESQQQDNPGNTPDESQSSSHNIEDIPEDMPDDEDLPAQQGGRLWWLWLLLALAIIGLLIWRGLWTRPQRIAAQHQSESAKLLVWYRALLGLLAAAGMAARPFETPMAYAVRVEKGIPPEAGLREVAAAVTRLGYGHRKATAEQVAAAEQCYNAVWQKAPLKAKGLWLVKRMTRGIGSVRQVP